MTALLLLLVLVPWSIARQMHAHPVTPGGLVKLPVIFAAIGLLGFGTDSIPVDGPALSYLGVSLALSVGLGLWRGAVIPVWQDADGTTIAQGNRTTLALWVALIASKVALGTAASLTGVFPGEHAGEIFVFIAISFAAQNLVVARRGGLLAQPYRSTNAASSRA
jgi:hypothetical protein